MLYKCLSYQKDIQFIFREAYYSNIKHIYLFFTMVCLMPRLEGERLKGK